MTQAKRKYKARTKKNDVPKHVNSDRLVFGLSERVKVGNELGVILGFRPKDLVLLSSPQERALVKFDRTPTRLIDYAQLEKIND